MGIVDVGEEIAPLAMTEFDVEGGEFLTDIHHALAWIPREESGIGHLVIDRQKARPMDELFATAAATNGRGDVLKDIHAIHFLHYYMITEAKVRKCPHIVGTFFYLCGDIDIIKPIKNEKKGKK